MTSVPHLPCPDALRRLDDYVDRALSPEELREVERHLSECLHCVEKFRFEVALIEGLRTRLRRLRIPPGLLRSIGLRLRSDLRQEPFPET